jgi:hypothetical protein
MKPSAYLTHTAPGRCRVKIPGKRHDAAFFEALEPELINVPGVKRVTINTVTASILIQYHEQELLLQELKSRLGALTHFELGSEPQPGVIWENASRGLQSFDNFLQDSSAGHLDFRSLMFIAFVLMAVRQLQQGAVMGPAVNLLWFAAQLIMGKR